jgi:polysaccharide biosynthesis protein PslH
VHSTSIPGHMPGRTAPPRVLWVTEEAPDSSLGGGSIRQAHLFMSLASAFSVDLLLAGTLGDADVRAAAAAVFEIPKHKALWTDRASARRVLELAITLCSRYPLPAYMSRPARRSLKADLHHRHAAYDLICVEHESLAPVICRTSECRWVITFHHVLSGMIDREVALAPGARQRWFRARDARKARRLEAWALREYDLCITCSSEDAAALAPAAEGAAANPVAVVPNGVDLARYRATAVPSLPQVLFPGTLHYEPNVDGARWFCTAVWPRVREQVPAATLVLAGRGPREEVWKLADLEGVEVRADVPSMVPYFEAARAVVVPLRVGTGTRLKALEAMAAGRPVIGTSEGLAGLGIEDSVQALVADDPDAFAHAVVRALQSDEIANSLGAAGRSHVERHFGWEEVGGQFVAALSKLVETPSPDPDRV